MDGFELFGATRPQRRIKRLSGEQRGRAVHPPQPVRHLADINVGEIRCPGILALPNPDWLFHRPTISGPAEQLTAFNKTAAGAGVIPWHYDYDRMEEDWFHLTVSPKPPLRRTISVEGARKLAKELRDAVWERHEEAISQVGFAKGCAFDLHQLVPVPLKILPLGSDDPVSLQWMWEHWGTTWPLRHVKRTAGGCEFWAADWSPWRAVDTIRTNWPDLTFVLSPAYGGDLSDGTNSRRRSGGIGNATVM